MDSKASGRPSTPSLLADAFNQVAGLFRAEIGLLRSEMSEKLTQAISAVVVLVVAAVLVLAALILGLEGVVQVLIATGWQPYAASFLVAVVVAVLGIVAAWVAAKALSPRRLAPVRSMSQLGKVSRVMEEAK